MSLNIEEKFLLIPPNLRKFYNIKYDIYKLIGLSIDLLFLEDILSYIRLNLYA